MNMKKHLIAAALMTACLAGLSGAAQATVLDFEDLTTPGHASDVGIVEKGFQFSYNTAAVDVSSTGGFWSVGANGGHSGKYAAINDSHGDMTVTRVGGGAFSVQDLWLNGWQGEPMTSTIQGWLDGRLVDSVDAAYGSPWQNVALGFADIDQLVIVARDGVTSFLVDDIQVGDVPEPASLALFGLAAGALALARRRKA
jgi:hypothetical protein